MCFLCSFVFCTWYAIIPPRLAVRFVTTEKSFYLYEERRVGTDTAVDVMMSDIYLVYIEVNNIKGFCQKQVYLVTLVPKTGTF